MMNTAARPAEILLRGCESLSPGRWGVGGSEDVPGETVVDGAGTCGIPYISGAACFTGVLVVVVLRAE